MVAVVTIVMRRIYNDLTSWSMLAFFMFAMLLNFYVNVLGPDVNAHEHQFSGSRAKWKWTSSAVVEQQTIPPKTPETLSEIFTTFNGRNTFSANNFTGKHTLDAPLTERHDNNINKDFQAGNAFEKVSMFYEAVDVTTLPSPRKPVIWPSLDHYDDDRITAQIAYKPEAVLRREKLGQKIPIKRILLYHGYKDWGVMPGQQSFLEQKCPVSACELTDSRRMASSADAIIFRQNPVFPIYRRPPGQVWILYLLEAPYFTPKLSRFNGHFNWTASYRHDSDIAAPYEKFVKHDKSQNSVNSSNLPKIHSRNYAANKTKKIAWFVSNCDASNTRMEYAQELSKYMQVDIFGKCGENKCPRGKDACSKMLNEDYKFYLAFENSNCRDYITEKFYYTGLQHDVIPIVMGAAPEDYRRVAPNYSFIHVDEYSSAKQLATYLIQLDERDDLYNEYFKWKGTGTFINTYFWCRVCAMLHDTSREMTSYGDVDKWWRGKDVCIGKDRWGQHPSRWPYISDYYDKPST